MADVNVAAPAPAQTSPASARLPTVVRFVDFLPIIAATVIWAWPVVFVKYIQRETGDDFGSAALNFYRHAAAAAVLLAVSLAMGRQELAAVVRRWWVPLVLAAILAIVQVTWVLGAYLIPAAYSSLIERTTTISTLLLGYLFFRDERRVIRSGRFLLSGAVAMAAVVGVILFNRDFSAGGRVLVGTLVFVLSSALWAFYAVAIRGMTRGLSAMPTFAVTVAMVSVLLMPLAVHERKMGLMWSSPWNVQLAVVLLGAVCVGVVQVCYYVSLKRIGVAYSSLVGLCTPFLTALFAFLLLGEVLRTGQWLCGAVLVGSLAIMVWNSSGARAKCAEAREDRPHG